MVLRPAAEDTGILFALRDGSGSTFLTPAPSLVVETSLATVLGDGRETVATVEHLLATINGMGIDNIHIEVSGKEVPIMDGSAASFVYLLKQAGVRRLSKPRKVMAIKKALDFEQDGKYIKARPYDGLRLDYTIEFAHPRIGRQHLSMEITPENFSQHLAKARTFGFLKEVDYLHANGLALGGSLDNAVVLDEYNILNAEGLRFEDEFVRHKMLDFVGDIATFGARLQGSFEVFASGHALNNAFLRHLDENRDLYLEERVQSAPVAKEAPSRERLQPVPAMA